MGINLNGFGVNVPVGTSSATDSTITINVGSTRDVKTIAEALSALKKYAPGIGVGAQIVLDSGNYNIGNTQFSGITCPLEIKSADTSTHPYITGVVYVNTCSNFGFTNITFNSRVECISGMVVFSGCTFNHMLRASYGTRVYLNSSPVFTGGSTLTAIEVNDRSYVRIIGGSITGYDTGISANNGSYVQIYSAVTFTDCTTRENPVANTAGNDNSYIKDPGV